MIKFIIGLFSKSQDNNSLTAQNKKTVGEPFDLNEFNTNCDIKMFALSTCIHCKKSMNYLEECGVQYNLVYVDTLVGDQREAVVAEVKKHNPKVSFPTVVIKDIVVIGFNKQKIDTALKDGDSEQLYNTLQNWQGSKGYHLNDDLKHTMPLMKSLLVNKERFGYMACPCRLANGTIDKDEDIICPCVYRDPDIEEYHACYCGLYVTAKYNEKKVEPSLVPERRPAEKIL